MYQVTKHYCQCGQEALVKSKTTGEWFCIYCIVKIICPSKGIDEVYMAPTDSDTPDFFVPLADLLPIKVYWN